jgi:hypothetical protein
VGETGFVADTPADCARSILALRNDQRLHARMREAARQGALSASWDNVFAHVYETYDGLLQEGIKP